MTSFYYIHVIHQKRNAFMGHCPPPPLPREARLIPNTCINIVNIVPEMRIWSILLNKSDLKWCIDLSRSLFLYYVGVRSCFKGKRCLRDNKPKMWLFDHDFLCK